MGIGETRECQQGCEIVVGLFGLLFKVSALQPRTRAVDGYNADHLRP